MRLRAARARVACGIAWPAGRRGQRGGAGGAGARHAGGGRVSAGFALWARTHRFSLDLLVLDGRRQVHVVHLRGKQRVAAHPSAPASKPRQAALLASAKRLPARGRDTRARARRTRHAGTRRRATRKTQRCRQPALPRQASHLRRRLVEQRRRSRRHADRQRRLHAAHGAAHADCGLSQRREGLAFAL
jgi:hypothetical protein